MIQIIMFVRFRLAEKNEHPPLGGGGRWCAPRLDLTSRSVDGKLVGGAAAEGSGFGLQRTWRVCRNPTSSLCDGEPWRTSELGRDKEQPGWGRWPQRRVVGRWGWAGGRQGGGRSAWGGGQFTLGVSCGHISVGGEASLDAVQALLREGTWVTVLEAACCSHRLPPASGFLVTLALLGPNTDLGFLKFCHLRGQGKGQARGRDLSPPEL